MSRIKTLLIILSLATFAGACDVDIPELSPPKARGGVLDLSQTNRLLRKGVKLDGDWEFYWNQLLAPGESGALNDYFYIPSHWESVKLKDKKLSPHGFATFRLKVRGVPANKKYGLKLYEMGTAYRLYLNGRLLSENGTVAKSEKTARPQYLPRLAFFDHTGGDLNFTLQISNFSYNNGGPWNSIKLAEKERILTLNDRRLGLELFLCGSLFIMFLYHLVLYGLRPHEKSTIYFSLLCLAMAIRTLLKGERFLIRLFPEFSWEWAYKLDYFTVYLAAPLVILFVHSMYKEETHRPVIWSVVIYGGLAVLFVLFTPAEVFGRSLYLVQSVLVVGSVYVTYVLFRGLQNGKHEALLFLAGFVVFALTVVNDILYTNLTIKTGNYASLGLLFFVFSQSLVLSWRFARAYAFIERLTNDLTQTNTAYSRFVPREFLRFLNKKSIRDISLGDQVEKSMTIMFADIRSFTTLSEGMSPEDNFNFLNAFLKRMEPIIQRHNGFIDKYIGDAIMALFPFGPEDALLASAAMHRNLREFNEIRIRKRREPIIIGVGINTGRLMLGTIGGENRMDGTVISDAVNLGARLEGLTKYFGSAALYSQDTYKQLAKPEGFEHRYLGRLQVKGKKSQRGYLRTSGLRGPEYSQTKKRFARRIHPGTGILL